MFRPEGAGGNICWDCNLAKERERAVAMEASVILDNLDAWVAKELEAAGVAPRELKADRARVPEALKRAIPRQVVEALADGRIPAHGFGLGGNVGGGKTCAVVALLKVGAAAFARREAPVHGSVSYRKQVEFVSWPDEVTWIRGHATDPYTLVRLDHLATVPLLILDDLGRERIKGSYVDDWAASQLDVIVNARYRHERPTIWTANVEEVREDGKDLLNIYGAALLSRLQADNPMVWVPGLPNLRMAV